MIFGDVLVYVVSFLGLYTAVYFLTELIEQRHTLKKKSISSDHPTVTVIVPVFNEEDTLAGTLDSLLSLDYPKDKLTIVVVDDGSVDDTAKIGRKYARKHGITFYSKKNGGKYTALNYALKRCTTEYVGALDADSFVHSKALRRIMAYFDDPSVMAVTPSMKIYNPKNFLQHVQRIEYLIGVFLRKVFAFMHSIHVTPGPFTIYKKSFFDKYGPYKKAYHTEDIEIALRIQSHHYHIENCLDGYVYTCGPGTFKTLYKQRLRWYKGFMENVHDYSHLFSKKYGDLGLFVLPISFLSVALVIVAAFYFLYMTGSNVLDLFFNLKAVGFDIFNLDWFNWDPFLISLRAPALLSFLGLGMGILVLLAAKIVGGEKQSIIYSYVLYIFVYWILFSFWWLVAIYYKLFGKKTEWGHKSETG